jgi:hypothetical protein
MFLRRASLTILPYCGMLLVLGFWNEIRYWPLSFRS